MLLKRFHKKCMKNMPKKIKILCFGNEFIKEDSSAKELMKKISKEMLDFEFININSSFELLNYNKKNFIILDVVKNLKEPKFISEKDLEISKIFTAHDLDAAFFIKLLNLKPKIVGIPENITNKTEKKVKELLLRAT